MSIRYAAATVTFWLCVPGAATAALGRVPRVFSIGAIC